VSAVDSRTIVLGVVLVFLVGFAGLTVGALIKGGPDILTVASLLVIGLFAFGIIGALREPPEE